MHTARFSLVRYSVVTAVTIQFLVFASMKPSAISHSQHALHKLESPGAIFVVTTNADSGNGSLRKAIDDANAAAGADTIIFQIGTGFVTISPESQLPIITDPVTIDGTTQPGYAGVPLIDINGSFIGEGLKITSGNSVIKALGFTNESDSAALTLETGGGNTVTGCFFGLRSNDETIDAGNAIGILITNSPNNQIGSDGTTASLRNVIGNNDVNGIEINGAASTGNIIAGNCIGLRSNGNDLASNTLAGVLIDGAPNNRIGGVTAAERNVISGNSVTTNNSMGILINGNGASGNLIQGNYIGTDATGMLARGNRDGIRIVGAPNNTIGAGTGTTFGGACTGGCNLISGNERDGLRITGMNATGNRADYNYFGLNAPGTASMGGSIRLIDTQQNIIGKPLSTSSLESDGSCALLGENEVCLVRDGNWLRINTVTGAFTWKECHTGYSVTGIATIKPGAPLIDGIYFNDSTINGFVDFSQNDGFVSITPPPDSVLNPFNIASSDVTGNDCECPGDGEQNINGTITLANANGIIISSNSVGSSADQTQSFGCTVYCIDVFSGSGNNITSNTFFSGPVPQIGIGSGTGNYIADNRSVLKLPSNFSPPFEYSLLVDLNKDSIHNPNDIGDPDTGGNNIQNWPGEIKVLREANGSLRLTAAFNSTPNKRFRIQFYTSNSFTNYETGDAFIDQTATGLTTELTTDSNGNAAINEKYTGVDALELGAADKVFMSATLITEAPFTNGNYTAQFVDVYGDTSEFSRPAIVPKPEFDYNGDGISDISVFRPSTNEWHILQSGGTIKVQEWGLSNDTIAPADFDADGATDIAIFRPSEGNWYVLNSFNNTVTVTGWGLANDKPVPGDYDGDGFADFALFRESEGRWYRRDFDGQVHTQDWGLAGDKPVPADFDGDGLLDLSVFRPTEGRWYTIGSFNNLITTTDWGLNGDKPVPSDYSGDGRADYAVFRPSDNTWYRRNTNDNSLHFITWGLAGDVPAPGDYDGDGKTDLAVYRPSSGTWFVFGSHSGIYTQPFGLTGDVPTQNAFVY